MTKFFLAAVSILLGSAAPIGAASYKLTYEIKGIIDVVGTDLANMKGKRLEGTWSFIIPGTPDRQPDVVDGRPVPNTWGFGGGVYWHGFRSSWHHHPGTASISIFSEYNEIINTETSNAWLEAETRYIQKICDGYECIERPSSVGLADFLIKADSPNLSSTTLFNADQIFISSSAKIASVIGWDSTQYGVYLIPARFYWPELRQVERLFVIEEFEFSDIILSPPFLSTYAPPYVVPWFRPSYILTDAQSSISLERAAVSPVPVPPSFLLLFSAFLVLRMRASQKP